MKKCNKIKGEFLFVDEFIKQLDINDECITVDSITKFIHIFSEIEESRIKGKCTYRIEDLLIIILMAKLARLGDNACQIAAYAKANKVKLTMLGLIKDNKIPSHDTFRRLFMVIDPESLRNIFITKLENFFERIYKFNEEKKNYRHLGVDGKEFRGSGRAEESKNPKSNIATLNVFDIGTQICLFSEPIEKKESEITTARDILKEIKLKNVIITADALHNQPKTAQLIHERKGYYVFVVKENHDELKKEIMNRYDNPGRSKIQHLESDSRDFYFMKLPNTYSGCDWAGQKAYAKTVNKKNNEVMYFISNLNDFEAIKEAIENRWSIENDLHKNKDQLLLEDYVRYTNKTAIENMAIINNIIMGFYRVAQSLVHAESLSEVRIMFAVNPDYYMSEILEVITTNQLVNMIVEKLRNK